MQPALDLVVSLSRTPLSDARRERAERLLGGEVDWRAFFGAVSRWDIEPVVLGNLRGHFASRIPESVRERSAAMERSARIRALSSTLILVDLTARMEAAGITAIVLKGPAVSLVAYGDASLRTFADIDLLVRREDLGRARDLLLALGYCRDYDHGAEARLIADQHALEFSSSTIKVEIHWALLSRHLRFEIDIERLWRTSRLIRCGGSDIRTLATPELFVYLAAHGAKHEWERLRWICDIAQIAESLDDAAAHNVIALARQAGGTRILALGIHLARDIFGEMRSPLLTYMATPATETQALRDDVRARLGMLPRAAMTEPWPARLDSHLRPLVFWARARERRLDQLACLARVLFIPTENDRGPRPTRWLTRPLRLAFRAARHALRAATASA